MKLLLVTNSRYLPANGGAERSGQFVAESLAANGHTVRVVALALGIPPMMPHASWLELLVGIGLTPRVAPTFTAVEVNGVEVHAVTELAELRPHIAAQAVAFAPDVILVASEDATQSTLGVALAASRAPVVFVLRTLAFLPFGPSSFFPSVRRVDLLRRCAGIVTVGPAAADYVKRWSGLDATPLPLQFYGSPPFPDLGRFDAGSVTMINACAVKGISIFAALARALPETSFTAVTGWGTTAADCDALATMPNLRVVPSRPDVDAIYAEAKIVVVPSLWAEARARTVVEAMLRRIPVITSDACGLPEATLGAGIVVPVRPIESFERTLDERTLPIPRIADQDLTPWLAALRPLLADREAYDRQASRAQRAALDYVAQLSIAPFEHYLMQVAESRSPQT